METKLLMGAALAAWLAAATPSQVPTAQVPTAQNPTAQSPIGKNPDVEAHLSAAVIARAKGAYAEAIRELQAAQVGCDEATRARIQAGLAELRRIQDPEPASPEGPQDPVLDLIDTLNRGTSVDPSVKEAMGQLQQLGALIVPALLQKLPELGPFGRHNAMEVLAPLDDPRIAPALVQLLQRRDEALSVAIGQSLPLQNMHAATARPLAVAIAAGDFPPSTLLAALEVLLNTGADRVVVRGLVDRLLDHPAAHDHLLSLLDGGFALGDGVLDEIIARGEGNTRCRAMQFRLLQRADLTEPQALAGVAELPEAWRGGTASMLVERNPDWVHVAIAAITARPSFGVGQRWFEAVEWWRGGDEAAVALLQAPPPRHQPSSGLPNSLERSNSPVARAIETMVQNGWRMPPEFDAVLAERTRGGSKDLLVSALPDDAEARALLIWRGLGEVDRRGLVTTVIQQHRPWHRLAAEQLATMEPRDVQWPTWFEHDWRGIDAESTRLLAQTVERWQASAPPPSTSRRSGVATTATNAQLFDWRGSLITAVRSHGLPAEVILPLVDANDPGAWCTLCEVEPRNAFERAARWPSVDSIASTLLSQIPVRGDRRDVPLLARAMRSYAAGKHNWGGQGLDEFLIRLGGGNPALIELASTATTPMVVGHGDAVSAAQHSAERAQVEDLDALVAMLPDLHAEVAKTVLLTLRRQLDAENAGPLVLLLARQVDRPATERVPYAIPAEALTIALLDALVAARAVDAAAPAARLLARADARPKLIGAAADAVVALSTGDRGAMLARLLADERPSVVQAAFGADDIDRHDSLRAAIVPAVVRSCEELGSLRKLFEHLGGDRGLDVATELAASDANLRFSESLSNSVIARLGAAKDGALAGSIGRFAKHPYVTVRSAAANALGATFSKQAVPLLIEMLKDDDPAVRKLADERLADIANYFAARARWDELLK